MKIIKLCYAWQQGSFNSNTNGSENSIILYVSQYYTKLKLKAR